MKFKIIFNNDIRIFNSDSDDLETILPSIRTFVDRQFHIENFNAAYIDEENERITISTDYDLKDVISRYKELGKVPKIYITIKQNIVQQQQLSTDKFDNKKNWILPQQHRYYDENDHKIGFNGNGNGNGNRWIIEPSAHAISTRNKIFEVVDQLDMNVLPSDKEFISVAIGDPTKYPNLMPSSTVTKAVQSKLLSQQHNGYVMSYGVQEARVAISRKYTLPHIKVNEEDVILGIGASDAINMSLCALLNEGDNFLSPKPGYSFYDTVASRYSFNVKKYNLSPDNEWQIDIDHMVSLIDKRTKAILINNPSNPCGSVLTESNIKSVLKIAEDYSIPIISDEVYAEMVHSDDDNKYKFISMAALSTKVPILTIGGLSKLYLVPGWRVGWIVIHDPISAFVKVRTALQKLSTLLLGPNTLIQASIPSILFETPNSYYNELNMKLKRQSDILYNVLSEIDELQPTKCRGALYLMCKIKINKLRDIKNDIDFAAKLLREQGVLILPGTIFSAPNYFRAVVCPPTHVLQDLGKRLKEFCQKHSKNNNNYITSKM